MQHATSAYEYGSLKHRAISQNPCLQMPGKLPDPAAISSAAGWSNSELVLSFLAPSLPWPRRGVSTGDLEEELFIPPLAVPKTPERFYYKFGRPVRTTKEDQNNPERVQQLYQEVRAVLDGQNTMPVPC